MHALLTPSTLTLLEPGEHWAPLAVSQPAGTLALRVAALLGVELLPREMCPAPDRPVLQVRHQNGIDNKTTGGKNIAQRAEKMNLPCTAPAHLPASLPPPPFPPTPLSLTLHALAHCITHTYPPFFQPHACTIS